MVIVAGGLSSLVFKRIYKLAKKLSIDSTGMGHEFQGDLIQTIHHFKYLKATGLLEKFNVRLKNTIDRLEKISLRMGGIGVFVSSTREPMIIVLVSGVILIEVIMFNGSLSMIVLSLLFFYRALNSLALLQTQWTSFLNSYGAMLEIKSAAVVAQLANTPQ